jgi:hypothetical protein
MVERERRFSVHTLICHLITHSKEVIGYHRLTLCDFHGAYVLLFGSRCVRAESHVLDSRFLHGRRQPEVVQW